MPVSCPLIGWKTFVAVCGRNVAVIPVYCALNVPLPVTSTLLLQNIYSWKMPARAQGVCRSAQGALLPFHGRKSQVNWVVGVLYGKESHLWSTFGGNETVKEMILDVINQPLITLWFSTDQCLSEYSPGGDFTLMLLESVRNMHRRSMPMPQPAVGGSPYSSAVQNVSSMNMASSSPSALAWRGFNTSHWHTLWQSALWSFKAIKKKYLLILVSSAPELAARKALSV